MQIQTWISIGAAVGYFLLIIFFAIAIVMKRRPTGVSLAWLVLLFALPLVGMITYLVLGSQFLGARRLRNTKDRYTGYYQWRIRFSRSLTGQFGTKKRVKDSHLHQFIEKTMGIPALPGNKLELCQNSFSLLDRIVTDITQARKSIFLQFYIWWPEGACQRITEALLQAAERNVHCRILVDAVGSRYFLQHEDTIALQDAGILIEAYYPVGPIRMFFERIDIRNHRKIVVIDEKIAWTGSFNMIDPSCFKQDQDYGEWIDAMVRVEGPSAYMINTVFLWDWQVATDVESKIFTKNPGISFDCEGETCLHVLPSDPRLTREHLHQALLTSIYESKEKITITTPYFVPDDALFSALISAAKRGVKVRLILPKRTDSRIARFASRSYYQPLLEAGAQIMLFDSGLLHTKCVLVDNNIALFGSVNMDMRSVWLNMELTLVIYDEIFVAKISQMVSHYKNQSVALDLKRWNQRSFIRKIGESIAQLASPLL